jgi:hypothetical protein
MNEKRKKLVLSRLTQVTDKDWNVTMEKAQRLIKLKTGGRTNYGCHSETNLGMHPFDYYFVRAVEALYYGKWDWKYEKYSLSQQVCRIIGSMISEKVRKYEVKLKTKIVVLPINDEILELEDEDINLEEIEKKYQNQLKLVEEAIGGDDDLEYLWLCIKEEKTSDEIVEELRWTKPKYYKMMEKLRRKVMGYKNITSLNF